MDSTEMIMKFSTFMKRRSYSKCTIKTYTSNIKKFCEWLDLRKRQLNPTDYLSQ